MRWLIVSIVFIAGVVLAADTHYVRPPGTCTNTDLQSPYTNWDIAATNIQWAVNVAGSADTVWVTNGTYSLTNQISITADITVKSMNGYSNTIVNGNGPYTTNRCFRLTNDNRATVDGFTISNGMESQSGGGVHIRMGVIKNCLIVNNRVTNFANASSGAGIYIIEGVVSNCIIKRNGGGGSEGSRYGAGIYFERYARVYNCQISENTNPTANGAAGAEGDGWIYNSTIFNNYGNGLFIRKGVPPANIGTVVNCVITNNTHGGVRFLACDSNNVLRNCLVASNGLTGVFLVDYGRLENCTISGNDIGVATGEGFMAATIINTIISDNRSGTNWVPGLADMNKAFFTNSCSTPMLPGGAGNIDSSPRFQNAAEGNYRLNADSPCINAGFYQSWMTTNVDLDGRTRIRYGTVDMGVYEKINEATVYNFR